MKIDGQCTQESPMGSEVSSGCWSSDHDNDDAEVLYFRPLQPSDRTEIKALHEEWFPVSYTDGFYDSVVLNKLENGGAPLYSCVACAGRALDVECATGLFASKLAWENLGASLGISDIDQSESHSICPVPSSQNNRGLHVDVKERIVGCIVGCFVGIERCNRDTVSRLIWNPKQHTRLFYIMTLGTTKDYRKCGLGKRLVESCIRLVERVPSCGAVYLHVITFNTAAIQFYEKLGFYRVQEIEGEFVCFDEGRQMHTL